jgi:cytochrome c-type biogenesis protein
MELLIAAASAFWLGILTSISPCPLATNLAAISYIGRRVDRPQAVLWAGLLYTVGRMAAYLALAVVLVVTTLSIAELSRNLSHYMNQLLGPAMIVFGMALLGLISFGSVGPGMSDKIKNRIDRLGLGGALVLGLLFALSFCPTSAALFLSLYGLAVKVDSKIVLPLVYGVGTAVPVIIFSFILAKSAESLGRAYKVLGHIERWARMITGTLFILIGIWFSLRYIFGVV